MLTRQCSDDTFCCRNDLRNHSITKCGVHTLHLADEDITRHCIRSFITIIVCRSSHLYGKVQPSLFDIGCIYTACQCIPLFVTYLWILEISWNVSPLHLLILKNENIKKSTKWKIVSFHNIEERWSFFFSTFVPHKIWYCFLRTAIHNTCTCFFL